MLCGMPNLCSGRAHRALVPVSSTLHHYPLKAPIEALTHSLLTHFPFTIPCVHPARALQLSVLLVHCAWWPGSID